MNIFKQLVVTTSLLLMSLFFTPMLAAAQCDSCSGTVGQIQCGANSAASGDCNTKPKGSIDTTIKKIVNFLSIAVGIVAVIMIIIGGLRYVTSAGNQEGAKNARNTIVYAVIGLVIAAIAQVIVRFVLTNVTNT